MCLCLVLPGTQATLSNNLQLLPKYADPSSVVKCKLLRVLGSEMVHLMVSLYVSICLCPLCEVPLWFVVTSHRREMEGTAILPMVQQNNNEKPQHLTKRVEAPLMEHYPAQAAPARVLDIASAVQDGECTWAQLRHFV